MTVRDDADLVAELRKLHRGGKHRDVIALCEEREELSAEAELLWGLAGSMLGEQGDFHTDLRRLAERTPDNSDWESDVALAHILLGELGTAEELLARLVRSSRNAVDFGRYAAVLIAGGDEDRAAHYYREAIDREPGRHHWHGNLAAVLARQQKLEEALEHYDRALRIEPEFPQAVNGRRNLLIALDRAEELIEELERKLEQDPDDDVVRLQCASALIANNRFTDGIKVLQEGLRDQEEFLDLKQEDPERFEELRPAQMALLDELGRQWAGRQQHRFACSAFRALQALEPDDPLPAIRGEIGALVEMSRFEQAEERLLEAEELYPDANPIKLARTEMLTERGRYEEAETILRELVDIYPGNAGLMANLAQCLMWTGDIDEAGDWYEKAARINPQQLANMVKARRYPTDPAAIKKMESIAENKAIASGPRQNMAFSLAELHDSGGDCDRAFHFLKLANDLVCGEIDYEPEYFTHQIDRAIAIYDREYFDGLPPIRGSDRTAVFVVGLPRSGTTLTEQILCSHPDVFGAGELDLIPALQQLMPRVLKKPAVPYPRIVRSMTPELREEAARYYLYGLKQYDEEHPVVVDKLPHNFVNLGLIATILPAAKIVHVQRDPRDSAISNYQQNFKAKHGEMGYAFKLEDIASEINNYCRVMAHWREVLPLPVFEFAYEELVDDEEGTVRRLLDFIGLEWDDGVKDFHKHGRAVRTASVSQVRRPIYRSSRRKWRRYAAHLGPLIDNLDPEVLAPWERCR